MEISTIKLHEKATDRSRLDELDSIDERLNHAMHNSCGLKELLGASFKDSLGWDNMPIFRVNLRL